MLGLIGLLVLICGLIYVVIRWEFWNATLEFADDLLDELEDIYFTEDWWED